MFFLPVFLAVFFVPFCSSLACEDFFLGVGTVGVGLWGWILAVGPGVGL